MRRSHFACFLVLASSVAPAYAQPLPGTKPLTLDGDLAQTMLQGVDRYLTKRLESATLAERPKIEVEQKRQTFRKIVGVVDRRVIARDESVGFRVSPVLDTRSGCRLHAVRWSVFEGVDGEGLLLEPRAAPRGLVVVLPDADQTPEDQLNGVEQWARRLAENGFRVVMPTLIDRNDTWSGNPKIGRATNQTHREFIYRMAFEMGRNLIGYEIQRTLAVIDHYAVDNLPVGIMGHGEGGLIALYAMACEPRIAQGVVSGYFGPRTNVEDEPIYRNVWGLLPTYADGELLGLIAPRGLIVLESAVTARPITEAKPGRMGAAPGVIVAPTHAQAENELKRGLAKLSAKASESIVALPRHADVVPDFLRRLGVEADQSKRERGFFAPTKIDAQARQKRQFQQLVDYTQGLLKEAVVQRQQNVWAKLDTKNLEAFEKSQEPIRDEFWESVMGKLPKGNGDMKPRTRLAFETPKYKAYEVVLDLYDDVINFGILLVPTDIKPGEKRPAVVCQHGLEGRPIDVVNPKERTKYYNSFGAQLAERGYVVFAPQAPYIFKNQFRQITRKANLQGLTLYAIIIRQHEQILAFLGTLDFVDARKIAYYGLSYGGKVAMRIPAILRGYAAVICSGDFNEWIWKNVTLDWGGSYMFTGEYEMFEFNLGNTFNYAEMAALIAPRPFMVERGHSDGVGLDEYVAFEYAKVRRLYAQLGIADRTEIEFFVGGHVIHGQGTFAFLQKHLAFPPR